jgi:hypothetical protein
MGHFLKDHYEKSGSLIKVFGFFVILAISVLVSGITSH